MSPRKLQHYLPGFKLVNLIQGVAPYFVVPVGGKPPETIEEMTKWPIHYQFTVKTVYAAYPEVPRVKMDKAVYRGLSDLELIATLKQMGIPLPKKFAQICDWDRTYLTERVNYIECAFTITHRMCAERFSFQFRHTLASYHNAMVSALKVRTVLSYTFHTKGKLDNFVLADDLHTKIW
jgi:hypothetical protein